MTVSPFERSLEAHTVPGAMLAGKYRVERVAGAGSMGVVVLATHLGLEERVAVKLLRPEVARRPQVVARFLREARAAARIKSEHVCRVSDVGALEDGTPYMVMEYLEGKDLAAVLRARGPLPSLEVVDLVLQACEALAEAHVTGIVHRDLKPANLFLAHRTDGSSCVKVVDFGISKVLPLRSEDGQAMTSPSALLGSPLYMSPEQLRSSHDVDDRSDVWALGIILFELLTGVPPFDATSMGELVVSIAASAPRSLRSLRPDVPPALESIVMRCLEKDREHRFANVADLAVALGPLAPASSALSVERICRVIARGRESAAPPPFVQTASSSWPPPPLAQSAPPPRPRHRGAWIAAGALLASALAVVAVLLIARPEPPLRATSAPITAPPAPTMLEAAAPAPQRLELHARVIGRRGSVLTLARTVAADPIPPPGQRGTLSQKTRGDAGLTWALVADCSVLPRPAAEGVTVLELDPMRRDAAPIPLNTAVQLEWTR